MPKLSEIIAVIEKLAPPALAAVWDNSGLQVGDPDADVRKVLVSLDPAKEVIVEAASLGCGLVLTHHPLFFRPAGMLDLSSGQGAVVGTAIRAGVAIYSAHTSLDRVPGGVSAALAAKMGLKKTAVLEQADGWPKGYGFGRVGELAKFVTAAELAAMLKAKLGLGAARLTGEPGRKVRKVALCGGSGSELIGAAASAGADAFVTGDIKYHDALSALETGMAVIDIGHYGSELPALPQMAGLLAAALRKKGMKVAVELSRVQSEPWTLL